MRKCHIYLKNKDCPILVIGYIGHKIRKHGFSEFYTYDKVYQVWTKDIACISFEKGEIDGKET